MIERRIGLCAYRAEGAYSEIVLPGGEVVASYPHETGSYEAQAHELGYGSGAAMSLEHDAIHAALAGIFEAVSPTLSAVAGQRDRPESWMEEDLVKIIAARLNDPASDGLPGGGLVSWLRGQLRSPLGGPQ